jgi:outer membrane lipoprotein-sorting protein
LKTVVCALIIVMVLLASSIHAADFDARQLVDHLYMAKGLMPINDLVIELEESVSGGDGKTSTNLVAAGKDKIYFKSPCKLRIDIVTSDPGGPLDQRNMIIIRDGKNAWQYLSTGQYPVKKKADEPSPPLNIPFGIVRYPQDIEKTYTVTGTELIDNVNTTVVKIASPSNPGEETTVWIDRTRWVPLKLVLKKKGDKGEDKVKKVLYREIGKTRDGRFFPFKLEKYLNEALNGVVVYKALAVNAGLEDSLFSPMEKFIK